MKLNINQWNTVLAVLHEEADKREKALQAQQAIVNSMEKDYNSAIRQENWAVVDAMHDSLSEAQDKKREMVKRYYDVTGIIDSLEAQEV